MDGLWIIFPLMVGVMLWIGLSSRKRRRDEFGDASVRFSTNGVFEVVYECLDQLVAINAKQDFILVIDAKMPAKDSSGRVVARFNRTLGFQTTQVVTVTKNSEYGSPAPLDLISYEFILNGITSGDDGLSQVKLAGYRNDICPWVDRLFKSSVIDRFAEHTIKGS